MRRCTSTRKCTPKASPTAWASIIMERDRMRQSLDLAMEVQQNLLPKGNLKLDGFDIAGKSIYCDETGGDYYDFIISGETKDRKIGVAIGDVSGHGIPSALLMATVRSSLRQRLSLPGSIDRIITDVNRQLVRDVEDTGQFMTMFYLDIDNDSGTEDDITLIVIKKEGA